MSNLNKEEMEIPEGFGEKCYHAHLFKVNEYDTKGVIKSHGLGRFCTLFHPDPDSAILASVKDRMREYTDNVNSLTEQLEFAKEQLNLLIKDSNELIQKYPEEFL